MKNGFVFCEFISQSYRFPLQKSFTKTVFVEFAKGYLAYGEKENIVR